MGSATVDHCGSAKVGLSITPRGVDLPAVTKLPLSRVLSPDSSSAKLNASPAGAFGLMTSCCGLDAERQVGF